MRRRCVPFRFFSGLVGSFFAISLIFSLLCCKSGSLGEYVKIVVNRLEESPSGGYEHVQDAYLTLRGTTLADGQAEAIRAKMRPDGFTVGKWFYAVDERSGFRPSKDYIAPDAMPEEGKMAKQITDLENTLFFEDAEIYSYYVPSIKNATGALEFSVKCLDFSNDEYGSVPDVKGLTITMAPGDEFTLSNLKRLISEASKSAGYGDAILGGKVLFASYSGRVCSADSSDDWYTADTAIAAISSTPAQVITSLSEGMGRKLCVCYEWTKPRGSLELRINYKHLNLSQTNGDNAQASQNAFDIVNRTGIVYADSAVFSDESAHKSISEYLKDHFTTSKIELPYFSGEGGNKYSISHGENTYISLDPSPASLYMFENTVTDRSLLDYINVSISSTSWGNGSITQYSDHHTWQSCVLTDSSYVDDNNLVLAFSTDSEDGSQLLRTDLFSYWTSLIPSAGVSRPLSLYVMYNLAE